MARARIYIRRSSDDQSQYSPEAQERQNRLYCELHGHDVAAVYVDDDLSGTLEQRAAFQRLLVDACADPGSLVIVHKIDRLARDAEVVLRTAKRFDKAGVSLVSVSEQIDFSSPIGRVMLTQLAAFAEYYSRNLGTEIKKGLREKAMQGGWIGLPPFGYEADGPTLKPSADAPIVQLIFEMYATSTHTMATITEYLNDAGYTFYNSQQKTRTKFHVDTVGSIIENRAYLGFVSCSGVEYPGVHPPLIDRDIWEKCAEIRAARRSRGGGRIHAVHAPPLLHGIARCAQCDAPLYGVHSGVGASRHLRYYCSGRRKYGRNHCAARTYNAAAVHAEIHGIITALQIPEPIIRAVIAEVEQRVKRRATVQQADPEKIRNQLTRLREVYVLGDIDEATYRRERERYQARLNEAVTAVPVVPTLDVGQALATLRNMSLLWNEATEVERATLAQQVIAKAWVDGGSIRGWEPGANYSLLAQAAQMAQNVTMAASTGIEAAIVTCLPPLWIAPYTPQALVL